MNLTERKNLNTPVYGVREFNKYITNVYGIKILPVLPEVQRKNAPMFAFPGLYPPYLTGKGPVI